MTTIARQVRSQLPLVLLALALAGATIAGALALSAASGATSQATPDQTLTGNPDCNFGHFTQPGNSYDALRQEFVPSQPFLTGVDLCLTIEAGIAVDLNVRSGTATTPGPVLASTSAVPGSSGIQYVHVELSAALAVTPGTMLVLEVTNSYNAVWWGTCAEVVGSCTSVDPDLYPGGQSSGAAGVGDFGFRTYGSSTAPTPIAAAKGDIDCDGKVTAVDALDDLRVVAVLNVTLRQGCPPISSAGLASTQGDAVAQLTLARGDIDCDGEITAVDALMLLRHVAQLAVTLPGGCAAIGA